MWKDDIHGEFMHWVHDNHNRVRIGIKSNNPEEKDAFYLDSKNINSGSWEYNVYTIYNRDYDDDDDE